jgi:hypothetical protein
MKKNAAAGGAANVADSRVLIDLLHEEERKVWGCGAMAATRARPRRSRKPLRRLRV